MSFAIPRDYSLIAPVYDHVFNRALSEGHRRIGSLLRTKRPARDVKVLEVGVGSGLTLDYLPNTIQFTGIDINEKMLSLAHTKARQFRRKNISLSIMDAHKLTFKANSFDMVVAASVITAVKDPTEMMKEMIRVTKKGGQIAIIANIRNKHSVRSQFVKQFDPLTKKFLGFRTDIDSEFFHKFKDIRMIEKDQVNNLFGFPLSSFLLFEKI
jgi:phosphatidylethanolamine/phosphatidyl-N-methylethanolamine N-methyltransferase